MPVNAARPSHTGTVPWPDDVTQRYLANGYWEGLGLGEHLYAAADATPDAICVVDGDLRLTYRELMARADGAAVRLGELGLGPDDRIVVALPNCWEFVVLTIACFRLGAIPVMALPAHRHREIAAVTGHAEARAIVVPDAVKGFDHQTMAREIADAIPSVDHVMVVGDDVRPDNVDLRALCRPAEDVDRARRDLDRAAPAGDAVALFLLSGGTTGLPKLVARTHNDYAYMIKRAAELCRLDRDTTYLAALPLAHGYPMAGPGMLGVLTCGGRVVIATSPAPERAFALIERERVTLTSLIPAAAQRWLDCRDTDPASDLGSLRLMQVAASRLADSVASRITPTLGCALQQVYGMSEGLLCLTRLDDPPEVVHHTQGRPICPDDELRVVDDRGEPVRPGEPGVLLTRGPYTPRGYYRAGAVNAHAFLGDGWYRTGDIVRLRPDGNLIVEGRDKDVINRGGEKVSAEEIEAFAYQSGAISLAAAVAMPDAGLGERVCLYVVPYAGRTLELIDVHAVLRRAGLAGFKMPDRLVVVESLPTTPLGKLDKKALRVDIARRLEAEHAADATLAHSAMRAGEIRPA